jgi:hypothetical protein
MTHLNLTVVDFFRIFIPYPISSFLLSLYFHYILPSFLPYSLPIPFNLKQQLQISAVLRTTLFKRFHCPY